MLTLLKDVVLPPSLLLVLILAGLLMPGRRWARMAALAALAVLVALSTPLVSTRLMCALQDSPPLDAARLAASGAQASVVLGAEMVEAPEYGGETIGLLGLERVRYGAHLHRRTGLPLLMSGGVLAPGQAPLATEMARVAENDLGVPVAWTEAESLTTAENAARSAAILKAHAIHRVLLVTQAWHMRRAEATFRRHGIEVVPAPTGFSSTGPVRLSDLVPSAKALLESAYAVHEVIGALVYRLRSA